MKITPRKVIVSGVATLLVAWLLTKSKRAHSTPNPSSILLIGDSQTKRHLGDAYIEVFSDLTVNFFGKEGATHEDYLNDKSLISSIEALGCADIIVIQLGDNGVPNRNNSILKFTNFIVGKCPNSKVFWGGPMKAVKPSIKSSYVDTQDPQSPRYLPTYNNTRKVLDSRLREALSDSSINYISNFDLQASQDLNSSFSDSRKGDGVHLTKDSALELSKLHKKIILGDHNARHQQK